MTEEDKFMECIYKKHQITSQETKDIYVRFNKSEAKLLDELIIKCFPESYLEYLDNMVIESQEKGEKISGLLAQAINEKMS